MTTLHDTSVSFYYFNAIVLLVIAAISVYILVKGAFLRLGAKFYLFSGVNAALLFIFANALSNIEVMGGSLVNETHSGEWLLNLKIGYILLFFIFIIIYEIVLLRHIHKYCNEYLTSNSIKEAFDALADGICFSSPGGKVLLVNEKMQYVCEKIFGEILLNTDNLDDMLKTGETVPNVAVIAVGDDYIAKSGDEVWSISHTSYENLKKIIAIDISQEYRVTSQIEANNNKIKELQKRINTYSRNVKVFTREKEILMAKTRVHDNIGRALLVCKSYLNNNSVGRAELLSLFEENTRIIKGEVEQADINDWDNLLKAANHVNVSIGIKGKLPDDKEYAHAIIMALLECLNNTVRHAGGDAMNVEIHDDNKCYLVIVTNNGKQPEEEIVEKGGLLNMRCKLGMLGGTIKIQSMPHFKVEARIPYKGEKL